MQPETAATKKFEFTGTAGSFFVNTLVSTLLSLIPLVGFAFSFNYQNKWYASNLKIDGRKLAYKAGFGEAWVMLFVGLLLTVLTFGIYVFWFVPKAYRFVLAHSSYADEVAPAAPAIPEAATTADAPASDVTPSAPVTETTAPTTTPTPPTTLVQ